MRPRPRFCFFVESRHEWQLRGFRSRRHFLEDAVFSEALCQDLAHQGHAVALASHVEEDGMAALVERLTAHGVEVDLWLNLSTEQDYWLWRGNLALTTRAIHEALAWMQHRGLKVRRLGLDLETPLALAQALFSHRLRPLLRELRRAWSAPSSAEALHKLVTSVNQHLPVDFYVLPGLGRWAWLRRLLGLHEVTPGMLEDRGRNRVVPMLYSSAMPPLLRHKIRLFRAPGQGLALGVLSQDQVSPGVALRAGAHPAATMLDDRGLQRDLAQVAALRGARGDLDEVHFFALNGPAVVQRVQQAWDRVGGVA